jgi:hypothetical protein
MEAKNLTDEEAKAVRDEINAELYEGKEPVKETDDQKPKTEVIVEEDPWAGVNPTLKKEFEDLRTKAGGVDAMAERLKQAESRIGSITNQLHSEKKAAETVTLQNQPAPTKEQIAAAAQSDEEWNALKEEFPTWGSAVEKKFASERAATLEEIKALKSEISALKSGVPSEEVGKKIEEVKIDLAKQMVSLSHKNWEQTVKTPEFGAWLNSQPAEIKQKCESWNIADAISVLDLFDGSKKKKTAAEIAADRKERLNNSQNPSSGRVRQTAKLPDDMTDDEYRKEVARELWAS